MDSAFLLEPKELENLVKESQRAYQSLGKVIYGPSESEKKSILKRRSLYISKDINKGEILTKENIKKVRPGYGLQPKYMDIILGKKINCNAKIGTPISWDIIG